MGVHKRQREIDELKENYIKKSSCIFLVLIALLFGAFAGNQITVLYLGQKQARQSMAGSGAGSAEAPAPHTANPEALARLEQAAVADPTNFEAWVKLGNFCFDHDMPEKAITAYERAVELSSMQINVWSDLGVMYRRTGQFEKAIEAFGHAASLDKTHVTSRFNMGIVYFHDLGNKAEALKVWESVLAIDPNAVTPAGQKVSELVDDLKQ